MSKILVTGSKAGLGLEIARVLRFNNHNVIDYDIKNGDNVLYPEQTMLPDELDVLINNAGVNKINWLEDITGSEFDDVMDVNAKGIFKMAQACLPALIKSKGTILNIVSNAAHNPMRCSLAYNASKAAAHIMTLQLARELTPKYGIIVFGVAPNRLVGTEMSDDIDRQVAKTRDWTFDEMKKYQKASLLIGQETPPRCVAEFIGYLLNQKSNHKFLTGCVLPYGA